MTHEAPDVDSDPDARGLPGRQHRVVGPVGGVGDANPATGPARRGVAAGLDDECVGLARNDEPGAVNLGGGQSVDAERAGNDDPPPDCHAVPGLSDRDEVRPAGRRDRVRSQRDGRRLDIGIAPLERVRHPHPVVAVAEALELLVLPLGDHTDRVGHAARPERRAAGRIPIHDARPPAGVDVLGMIHRHVVAPDGRGRADDGDGDDKCVRRRAGAIRRGDGDLHLPLRRQGARVVEPVGIGPRAEHEIGVVVGVDRKDQIGPGEDVREPDGQVVAVDERAVRDRGNERRREHGRLDRDRPDPDRGVAGGTRRLDRERERLGLLGHEARDVVVLVAGAGLDAARQAGRDVEGNPERAVIGPVDREGVPLGECLWRRQIPDRDDLARVDGTGDDRWHRGAGACTTRVLRDEAERVDRHP